MTTKLPDTIRDLLAAHNRVRPPPQGWSGAAASTADIEDLARRLGRSVPDELAAWLSFCDGCFIGTAVALNCSQIASDAGDLAARRERFPQYFSPHPAGIPVAADGCGSHYVMSDDGSVYFSDHEGPWYVVASSLWRFLACWIESEATRGQAGDAPWPFDEEWTKARDPELRTIAHNPWSQKA